MGWWSDQGYHIFQHLTISFFPFPGVLEAYQTLLTIQIRNAQYVSEMDQAWAVASMFWIRRRHCHLIHLVCWLDASLSSGFCHLIRKKKQSLVCLKMWKMHVNSLRECLNFGEDPTSLPGSKGSLGGLRPGPSGGTGWSPEVFTGIYKLALSIAFHMLGVARGWVLTCSHVLTTHDVSMTHDGSIGS